MFRQKRIVFIVGGIVLLAMGVLALSGGVVPNGVAFLVLGCLFLGGGLFIFKKK